MDFLNLKLHGKKLLVSITANKLKILFTNDIYFTGNSPGDYKDIKDLKPGSDEIKVDEGTLSIHNIQKTHEGHYLCEAVNGIGSGLSAVITISVQG